MLFLKQLCLLEKLMDGCFDILKAGVGNGLPGEHYDIPTLLDVGDHKPDNFANLTFAAVAPDGIANRSSSRDAETGISCFIGKHYQDYKRVGKRCPFAPHPLEIGSASQSKFAFHPCSRQRRSGQIENELTLPIRFLHVVVHLDRQTMATFCSATFDDIAPTAGGHSRTETMNSDTAAFFGLVCSFWHS
jgi:hypothetical protein